MPFLVVSISWLTIILLGKYKSYYRSIPRCYSAYGVEMRPPSVTTIQRLPQRTIDSNLPNPGTLSPRAALQIPSGPSKIAFPPMTSRTVHPSTVVGLVSGNGIDLGKISGRRPKPDAAGDDGPALCCATREVLTALNC